MRAFWLALPRLFLLWKSWIQNLLKIPKLSGNRSLHVTFDMELMLQDHIGQGIQECTKQNFWKTAFHKFYLVHSWILCPMCTRWSLYTKEDHRKFYPSLPNVPFDSSENFRKPLVPLMFSENSKESNREKGS